jgi:hypothetical protein
MSDSNSTVPSSIPSVEEEVAVQVATWPVSERLCYQCGTPITDAQLPKMVCTAVNVTADQYCVTHGPGDCSTGFSKMPPAFGAADAKKAAAIVNAKMAMSTAMTALAEAKAMVKAEEAWMPMSESKVALMAAKAC